MDFRRPILDDPKGFPISRLPFRPLPGELPSLRAGWEEAGRDANDDASEVWGTTPGKRGMRRMATRAVWQNRKKHSFFATWGLVRGLDSETRLWLHYYIIITSSWIFWSCLYNVFNHVTNDVCPKLGWNLVFASELDGRPTEDLEMGSLPARSPKTFGGRLGTHSWVWVNPLCAPKMDCFKVERSKHDPNLWVIPQLRSLGIRPIRPLEVRSVWAQAGQGRLQATADLVSEAADYCRCWSTNIHQWNHFNTFFFSTKNRPVLFHSHRWHLFALSPSATIRQLLRVWAGALGQAELDVHTAIVEEYAQDAGSTVKSGMGKEKQERFSTVAIHRTASWLNGNLLREPGAGS